MGFLRLQAEEDVNFARLKSPLKIVNHLADIGVIKDESEFELLLDAETAGDAVKIMESIRDIDRDYESLWRPGEQITDRDVSSPATENEQSESVRLWIGEQPYNRIESMREDGMIEKDHLADTVFREVRMEKARKNDPVLSVSERDVLEVVNHLNKAVERGVFTTDADENSNLITLEFSEQ